MNNVMQGNITVDAHGFLVDGQEWTEYVAYELAQNTGIGELSEQHWNVIVNLRDNYFPGTTVMPDLLPVMCDTDKPLEKGHQSIDDLFGDPLHAWQIAGLPKPAMDMAAYLPSSKLA